MSFLRATNGTIPGGVSASKILFIGVPKVVSELPLCILDPKGVESCLLVLAELSAEASVYLVCPGANKYHTGRVIDTSFAFYSEGIRAVTLHKEQFVPFRNSTSSVPNTLQGFNNRYALKVAVAAAKCIAEIQHAEMAGRHEDFTKFIDTHVCEWPKEYFKCNRKTIVIWEDSTGLKHVSISPCLSELVRYCSGATSTLSVKVAPSTNLVAVGNASEQSLHSG